MNRLSQVPLRDHHVNAHIPIHQLRDVRIRGHRRGLIALRLRESLRLLKELHHLLGRRLRRDDE